jgi:hypothetical protein
VLRTSSNPTPPASTGTLMLTGSSIMVLKVFSVLWASNS